MIPEAAVDAAARSLFGGLARSKWEDIGPLSKRAYHEMARDALEAAAPHMLAAAWDDAIEAHKAWTWDDENMDPLANPYRPTP